MSPAKAAPAAEADPDSDADRENHMKEWEKARDTLQFFDDKLHDLRKYGFSFVTVLLTADGILFSTTFAVDVSATLKFAVFGVTLILILALHLIDKNYLVFQRAAATRAVVLEKELNLELSEVITDRYRIEHVEQDVLGVYLFFTLSVLFLGCISLGGYYGYSLILAMIAFIVTIFITRLQLEYKYKYNEDWTISPLVCSLDSMVKITLNNLDNSLEDWPANNPVEAKEHAGIKVPKPIRFQKDGMLWEIINEESGKGETWTANRDIDVYDNQTWILKGKDVGKPGVYQLRPRGWPLPLHRRITVIKNPQKQKRGK